ncbi:hypothetical protein CAPTEDRAFT_201510 [Capitella teleta]|uniref:G-protein coupled receptors family 1 profile domain-containing protein n=1 Tax=Capitella teleta TaxID=283909 RepID=R7UN12_CAPTE|nr:hypothetical protein CAPTEDRAFT_201510 [Capitella teleta]|eukprot:ELU07575.1 hypothetical protein CAPTEDRAFT_201510 [Capitella teleta]
MSNATESAAEANEIQPLVNFFLAVLTIAIIFMGFLVYCIVLFVVRKSPHLASANCFLMASLAASELLTLVFSVPAILDDAFELNFEHYHVYRIILTGIGMTRLALYAVSMATMAAILHDRYCFITLALNYIPEHRTHAARWFILISWTAAFVIPLCNIPCWMHKCRDMLCWNTLCFITAAPLTLIFIVCLFITMFSNFYILKTTFKHINHDRMEAFERRRMSRAIPRSRYPVISTVSQYIEDPVMGRTSSVTQAGCLPSNLEETRRNYRKKDSISCPSTPVRSVTSRDGGVIVTVSTPDSIEPPHIAPSQQSQLEIEKVFKTPKPLDLFLRVSCDMSSCSRSTVPSESLSMLSTDNSINKEIRGIPRIEVISPSIFGSYTISPSKSSRKRDSVISTCSVISGKNENAISVATKVQFSQQPPEENRKRSFSIDEVAKCAQGVVPEISIDASSELPRRCSSSRSVVYAWLNSGPARCESHTETLTQRKQSLSTGLQLSSGQTSRVSLADFLVDGESAVVTLDHYVGSAPTNVSLNKMFDRRLYFKI